METLNYKCYVSLEIAKLLKESGFNWPVNSTYRDGVLAYQRNLLCDNFNGKRYENAARYEFFSAPTLDIAQRWLREVKGMCLTIQPLLDKVNGQCNVVVGFTPFIYRMDGEMVIVPLDSEHTYEEAQEAGIKKTLEIILEKGEYERN